MTEASEDPPKLSAAAQADLEDVLTRQDFSTKGPIAIALVVVERARSQALPLDVAKFLAARGAQVAGASGKAADAILRRHGVTSSLGSEGGRTSRGSVDRMNALVEFMNRRHAAGDLDLDALQRLWVARAEAYFATTPIPMRMDPALSIRAVLRGLIAQAEVRQKTMPGVMIVGTVMQHIVGAALELRGEGAAYDVAHHGSNQNDVKGRGGDFDVGDTIIHVTNAPSAMLMAKCRANIEAGRRPMVISNTKQLIGAEVLAETEDLAGRIEFIDFEQFVAAKLYDRGNFLPNQVRAAVGALVDRYNEIVDAVEPTAGLRVEVIT